VRPGRLAGGAVTLALAIALGAGAASSDGEPVTFSDQVVRIFQAHCQACHRPGEVAPFALTTYTDAYAQRRKIGHAVRKRTMPPWKPVRGFGDFLEPRRLSDADVALIERWVAAGAPEGDPARLPPPRQFPTTWTQGPPDLVLDIGVDFSVTARENDLYRCFTIPTTFKEDRWISAVEYVPGNRRVVHHVLTYVDTTGRATALDDAEPGPGYTCFGGPGFGPRGGLGGWAPGARPTAMPDGVGMLLPAGARLVIQVHYHNRTGEIVRDQTRVGLRFARATVDKRVRVIPVLDRGFLIPAGAERHVVRASYVLPPTWHMHAIGVSPHMHLLGREMRVTATYPDGATRPLIYIDDWDFHWQGSYTFREPIPLPGGTRIDVEAVFDNSARNRRNPSSPPRDVTWGEGTTDEMCIAFVRTTVDAERLGHRPTYSGPLARTP
jgi:mono/diheme cytochrome c family protein